MIPGVGLEGDAGFQPSDNYETEWPSEDEFLQQDLDPSGDGHDGLDEGSLSAFTNFGFHF